MAKLQACRDCSQQVSKGASICPHCGAKQPKKAGFVAWAFAAVVVVGIWQCNAPGKPETAEEVEARRLLAEEGKVQARCETAIESQAVSRFEWTDSLGHPKFSHGGLQKDGTYRYVGDRLLVQNAFGAMLNQVYDCRYDPVSGRVTRVDLQTGKLPGS